MGSEQMQNLFHRCLQALQLPGICHHLLLQLLCLSLCCYQSRSSSSTTTTAALAIAFAGGFRGGKYCFGDRGKPRQRRRQIPLPIKI